MAVHSILHSDWLLFLAHCFLEAGPLAEARGVELVLVLLCVGLLLAFLIDI